MISNISFIKQSIDYYKIKNYNGMRYKILNNCLHLTQTCGLNSKRLSTKTYFSTTIPFYKIEKEQVEEIKDDSIKQRTSREIMKDFLDMSDEDRYKTLYWNKKYNRYENKIILEYYLTIFL